MKKKIILSLLLSVLLILSSCGKQVGNTEVSTIVSDDTMCIETIETETESSSHEKEIKEKGIIEIKEKVEQDYSSETPQKVSEEVTSSSSETSRNTTKKVNSSTSKTVKDKDSSSSKESKVKNPQPSSEPKPSNVSPPSKPPHTSCSFDGGKITTNATCNTEGEKTYTCTECGKTKSESIGKTTHNNVTETLQPTCTEAGKVKTYCTICGAVESETTGAGATGHNMIDSWFGDPPTCTRGGYLNRFCKVCDYLEISDSMPALEHNKISTESTYISRCTHIITTKYSCADCEAPLGQDERSEVHHTFGKVIDEWGDEHDACTGCGMNQP